MYAIDFEYDGRYLSDYGFMICNFDSNSGSKVVSAGSKITFNTVPMHRGKIHSLTSTQYDECITATFSICKNRCDILNDDMRITNDEYRDIMRWLNRHEYLTFQIFDENDPFRDACFYQASFNISKVLISGLLYGLELTMTTNKPFGYGKERVFIFDIDDTDEEYLVYDVSDDMGYLYPNVTITCKKDVDLLQVKNITENCMMEIKNCRAGEVITVKGKEQILLTSNQYHDLSNDFNYEFLRIGNTFDNITNVITVNEPCIIKVAYRPIIKDSPEY